MKKLSDELGITDEELREQFQRLHPGKSFDRLVVVADEPSRFVVLATYHVEHVFRGHPPCLAFAVQKATSSVEEIDRTGYGLGIK